jgi:hypothetical protein
VGWFARFSSGTTGGDGAITDRDYCRVTCGRVCCERGEEGSELEADIGRGLIDHVAAPSGRRDCGRSVSGRD